MKVGNVDRKQTLLKYVECNFSSWGWNPCASNFLPDNRVYYKRASYISSFYFKLGAYRATVEFFDVAIGLFLWSKGTEDFMPPYSRFSAYTIEDHFLHWMNISQSEAYSENLSEYQSGIIYLSKLLYVKKLVYLYNLYFNEHQDRLFPENLLSYADFLSPEDLKALRKDSVLSNLIDFPTSLSNKVRLVRI